MSRYTWHFWDWEYKGITSFNVLVVAVIVFLLSQINISCSENHDEEKIIVEPATMLSIDVFHTVIEPEGWLTETDLVLAATKAFMHKNWNNFQRLRVDSLGKLIIVKIEKGEWTVKEDGEYVGDVTGYRIFFSYGEYNGMYPIAGECEEPLTKMFYEVYKMLDIIAIEMKIA